MTEPMHRITLGKLNGDWKGYGRDQRYDGHILTIAQSGGGKTKTSIIPTLLTFTGSAFVIDPKGEITETTAAVRKAMGQQVYVVDPFGRTSWPTSRINPLDQIAADDESGVTDALRLADTLIIANEGENRFFSDEARALLRALILHTLTSDAPAYEKRGRNLAHVNDQLAELGDILPLMAMNDASFGIISRTARRFMQKAEREFSSIASTAQTNLGEVFDDPRLRRASEASDFGLSALKDAQRNGGAGATIYIVLPERFLDTFGRWLRLLVTAALDAMTADQETVPSPVLFILEEFAHLGRLEAVETAFGIARGAQVRLWAILQNLSQVDRHYGEDARETFVGNVGALEVFNVNDNITSEYISKKIGNKLITRTTESRQTGGAQFSTTIAETHTIEPAYQPNEITFGKGEPGREMEFDPLKHKLLFISGRQMITLDKCFWFDDEKMRAIYDGAQKI